MDMRLPHTKVKVLNGIKVLVIEERFPFDKEEHKRWLYTACTRAAKN